MIRGTTPTFTFRLKDKTIDLGEALTVIATIKQSGKRFDISGERLTIDGGTISFWLTQEESLKLSERIPASIQLNWTYPNQNGSKPRRASTVPKSFCVTDQYYEKVIE